MFKLAALATLLISCQQIMAFVSNRISSKALRMQPVHENFFFDFAEDAAANTPKEIFGEANYKGFVASYDANGLLVRGGNYNVVERIRELRLLSLTVDSGLLEALESKGLTLSQVEKLLPVADKLGLLPLLAKNKELALSLAPLLIEPAPLLLPIVVGVVKSSPSTFLVPGLALIGAGGYEIYENSLLGYPLVLLGLPLAAVGTVLNTLFGSLKPVPVVSKPVKSAPVSKSTSAPATVTKPSTPKTMTKAAAAPSVKAAPKVAVSSTPVTRPRKTIKVKV